MNSSAQPSRRIASNLLWSPQGIVRNPLLTLSEEGRVLCIATCDAPDREACVEHYPGLLVPDFPADYAVAFEHMCAQREIPLLEQLARLPDVKDGVLVVVSGLDYDAMRLTPDSRIRRIG